MRRLRWFLVVPAALAVVLLGLELTEKEASEDAAAGESEPAHVEPVPGSALSRVTLTASAAERLGVETVPIRNRAGRKIAPYSAILYDERGKTWVYTQPARLTFVRAAVEIAAIRGNEAILTSGPPVGTEVASVAAAELFGTEFEVDH
jgi:hypothetical protein